MVKIKENLKNVKLIETRLDLDKRKLICYPYYVMEIQVTIPRPFVKSRIVRTVITADLVKGAVMRSDCYPKGNEIYLSNKALIPPVTSLQESEKKAEKLALRWALSKYHLMRSPNIEVVKSDMMYKAFCLLKMPDGQTVLVDSMKGMKDTVLIQAAI